MIVLDMECPSCCDKCPFVDNVSGFCLASDQKQPIYVTYVPRGTRSENCPIIGYINSKKLFANGSFVDFAFIHSTAQLKIQPTEYVNPDDFYKRGFFFKRLISIYQNNEKEKKDESNS